MSVLKAILKDLDVLAGKTFTFTLDGHITAAAKRALAMSGLDPSRVTSKSDDPRLRDYGSAAGSRSWTKDGKLPPGLSTVGERGWELVSTDRSGRSEVFSHADSMAMTGKPGILPGFASGTSSYSAIASLLKSLGATRAGIAGFLGNTKIESGGRTTAVGGPAHGLQQWQDGRFAQLQRLAASMGVSWKSQQAQLAMIRQELTHGYKGTLTNLRHAKSASAAAAYVDAHYEISSGAARGAREAAARSFAKSSVSKGAGGTYKVNGIDYSTSTAAHNAQVRAAQATAKAADRFLTAARNSKDTYTQLAAAAAALKNAAHRQVSGMTTILADAKKRDQVRASLTSAQSRLKTAQGAYGDAYHANVASVGQVDYTTLGIPTQVYSDKPAPKQSAATFITGLKGVVAKSKSFAAVLKKLVREGMPRGIVTQLAAAGPDALAQAQALAASTPKQLAQIKSLYKQQGVNQAAGGKAIADAYFLAGVQSAQGIVKGLESQESSLNKAITRLADGMVYTLKKKLKIHSPSQVMRWHGQMSGEGFALGIDDKLARIEQAGSKMTGVPPRPGQPRLKLDSLSSGTTAGTAVEQHHHYSYTINAMDWSPEAVVNAMRRREIRDTVSKALFRNVASNL